MYTIYLITNLVNGKVYVGQTVGRVQRRWTGHCSEANRRPKYPLGRAIRKYGKDNFSVREIQKADSLELANSLEECWIFLYDSRKRTKGYNIRVGGNSSSPAESTKKKLSAITKQAWSEGKLKGYPHSEHTKERISVMNRKRGPLKPHVRTEDLLALWNGGTPVQRIAEMFAISGETVRDRIKKSGLAYLPFHPKRLDFDTEQARKLRAEGLSYSAIAREMGSHLSFVFYKLNPREETRHAAA